ncbi:MAG: hydrolase, partial [Muribaculaceae bacterium]|nr:hydrolase [Muribaculaceae bacterium]
MVPHDISGMPVLGTLATDATKKYSRLPDSLEAVIRPDLWALGLNSAGLSIRFRSDATD